MVSVRAAAHAMARERSIESRIKEHTKFREQCRRRIRPSITLFLIALAVVSVCAYFRPISWWVVVGVLVFTGGHTLMEIVGYRYHVRKLRELAHDHVV
jgi:hypothetical protein